MRNFSARVALASFGELPTEDTLLASRREELWDIGPPCGAFGHELV